MKKRYVALAILGLMGLDVLAAVAINRHLTASDAYWRAAWDEVADGGRAIQPYGKNRRVCRYDRAFGLYGYQFCFGAQGGTLQFYWQLTSALPLFTAPLLSQAEDGYRFREPIGPAGDIPSDLVHPDIRK